MAEKQDADLPMTQPVDDRVLKDVVAFVEVRTANDNRSESVRKELERLGATVMKKFTDDVTHVIFKEGSNRTKIKAQKKDVHFVSVLWVDHCKRNQEHVSERMFPAHVPKAKGTPLLFGKMKKAKSMQPRDFHEELADSAERVRRKRKRLETLQQRMQYSDSTPPYSPRAAILVQDTQPRSPDDDFVFTPVRLTIPDTPPGMRERMKELNLLKEKDGNPADIDIESEAKQENLKFLQKKLFAEPLDVSEVESVELVDKEPLTEIASTEVNEEVLNIAQKIRESLGQHDQFGADSDDSSLNLSQNMLYPNTENFTQLKSLYNSEIARPNTSHNDEGQKQNIAKKSVKVGQKSGSRKSTRRSVCPEAVGVISHEPNTCISTKTDKSHNTSTESVFGSGSNTSTECLHGSNHSNKSPGLVDNTETQSVSDELHLQLSLSPITGSAISTGERDGNNKPSIGKENKKGRRKSSRCSKPLSSKTDDTSTGNIDKTDTEKSNKQGKPRKKKLISLSDLMDRHSILIEPTKSSVDERKQLIGSDDQLKVEKRKCRRIAVSGHNVLSDTDIQEDREHKASKTKGGKNKVRKTDLEGDDRLHGKPPRKKRISEKAAIVKIEKVKTILADDTHVEDKEVLVRDKTADPLSDITTQFNLTKDKSLTCSIRETTLSMSMSRAYPDKDVSSIMASTRLSMDEFSQKHVRKGRNRIGSKRAFTSIREIDNSTTSTSDSDKSYKTSLDLSGHRKKMRPSIVMTSLHSHEQDVVISVVKKLGRFVITDSVNETTTHLVCGEPRRTLNILHCLARGLWLLSKEWVIKSLEAGEWIPEESFECVEFFPICKVTREEREQCTHVYRQTLFTRSGLIYISGRSSPPRPQLVQLVKLCGGQVTGRLEKAGLYVGGDYHPGLTCVKTTWLLDCIKAHETLPLERYSLDRPKRESSPVY